VVGADVGSTLDGGYRV